MLCSPAFAIRVTVVSFCESEFVCRQCESSGSFVKLRSTVAVETTLQPLALTTALPPCPAKESRCGSFLFFGRSGLSPIPWWVEKTGVGLCAVGKDGFSNKTEQPKLMYEMERRFYQVGMVVCPRRQVSLCLERTANRRPEVLVSSAILFGGIEE